MSGANRLLVGFLQLVSIPEGPMAWVGGGLRGNGIAAVVCAMLAAAPGWSEGGPIEAVGGAPVLETLFPRGAVCGTTTHWTMTGRNLGKIERFVVSGEGVSVEREGLGTVDKLRAVVRVDRDARPGIREVRVEGSSGISNLLLFRLDTLPQLIESEPNDDPARANRLALGLAVAGVLEPQGLDHYELWGRAGALMVVEVEARRLGIPIVPMATILSASGNALLQVGETPGLQGDCRAHYRFPADGRYLVQVRDQLYRGGPGACYRLRVTAAPLATGLFPLGGTAGSTIEVEASGGTLAGPRRRRMVLPAMPGAVIEPEPFEGRGGAVVVSQRLAVGEGPEFREPTATGNARLPHRLTLGTTVNGRLERAKEVDRYLVQVHAGERIRVAVEAATLGSWLDSVVSIRNDRGTVVAENDDLVDPITSLIWPRTAGTAPAASDSRLEYAPEDDGQLLIEIRDRYGEGGAEYAYRLTVGPARPDFAVGFVPADGEDEQRFGGEDGDEPEPSRADDPPGGLNLAPGTSRQVKVGVALFGRGGPVVVRAVGLPPGVTAEPATIRPDGGGLRSAAGVGTPRLVTAWLRLEVAPEARPALGSLRIIASAARPDGTSEVREGSTMVQFTGARLSGPGRPVVLSRRELPVKVVAGPSGAR